MAKKHGFCSGTKHPLYSVWNGMKQRCLNPTHPFFEYYGGRGITVCERWQQSFPAFVQDVGERPPGYTLDRINNDGNYEPGNCRWVSRKDQALNKRDTRTVVIEGIEYKAGVLADIAGLKTDTILARANTCHTLQELLDPHRRIFWQGLAMTPNSRNKTHCTHGHEYTKENTYLTPNGHRQCRQCKQRDYQRNLARRSDNIRRIMEFCTGHTHCKHGHEFTPENTYWNPRGHRQCRTCMRARDTKHRRKRRPL